MEVNSFHSAYDYWAMLNGLTIAATDTVGIPSLVWLKRR